MVDDDGFDVAEMTQRGCDLFEFRTRRVRVVEVGEERVEEPFGLVGLGSDDDFVEA